MTWSQPDTPLTITPEALAAIAAYADLPLLAERAAALAPLLTGPLAVVRALHLEGYDDLQPATAYRVPQGG
ncbi:MAG TPA: hypothetical protein VII06_13650 [Chloroflexota bacterium]|jgi:hypothetical protein